MDREELLLPLTSVLLLLVAWQVVVLLLELLLLHRRRSRRLSSLLALDHTVDRDPHDTTGDQESGHLQRHDQPEGEGAGQGAKRALLCPEVSASALAVPTLDHAGHAGPVVLAVKVVVAPDRPLRVGTVELTSHIASGGGSDGHEDGETEGQVSHGLWFQRWRTTRS